MRHELSLALAMIIAGQGAMAEDGMSRFLDNRSGPADLVRSFYNALDLHQYARAYTYFRPDSAPKSFAAFAAGYAQTEAVSVRVGKVVSEGAAGSIYATVPVVVQARLKDGTSQLFGGCYLTRQVEPGLEDPPVTPIQIVKGHLAMREDETTAMPKSCSDQAEPLF